MNMDVETVEGLANAVEWMRGHVGGIADGGSWIIPRSMSVVRVDKKNKIATRLVGFLPETSTQKVFEAMGWKWKDDAT